MKIAVLSKNGIYHNKHPDFRMFVVTRLQLSVTRNRVGGKETVSINIKIYKDGKKKTK